jgi:hypothetical protein
MRRPPSLFLLAAFLLSPPPARAVPPSPSGLESFLDNLIVKHMARTHLPGDSGRPPKAPAFSMGCRS